MHFDQHNHYYFNFFKNKNIGALYLTVSLISFANGLINVFVPIYLWQQGFALWQILYFFFLFSVFASALSILLIPIFKKTSDRQLIFFSIPPLILYYLGLDFISGMDLLFYALPFLLALKQLLFNLGYNLSFSVAADDADMGKESGFSVMAQSISPMAAPILGGFLITIFGFENSFFVGSAILVLAIVPLLAIPSRFVSKNINFRDLIGYLKNPQISKFNLSEVALGIDPRAEGVIWALFMFIVLGSIQELGTILSIGLLAASVISYLVGTAVDRGYRKQAMSISTWGVAVMWFLRPFFFVPLVVVGNHIIRKAFRSTMQVAWSAEFYDIARHVKHVSLFLLSKEFFLNLVRAIYTGVFVLVAMVLGDIETMQISFVVAGLLTLFGLYANKQKSVRKIDV